MSCFACVSISNHCGKNMAGNAAKSAQSCRNSVENGDWSHIKYPKIYSQRKLVCMLLNIVKVVLSTLDIENGCFFTNTKMVV